MTNLKNRVALVTGSARGIGRAIALRFAREQAVVGLMDLRDPQPAAEEMNAKGYTAVPLSVDITEYEAVVKAVDTVFQKYGRIDILVNNAAIIVRDTILELSHQVNIFKHQGSLTRYCLENGQLLVGERSDLPVSYD